MRTSTFNIFDTFFEYFFNAGLIYYLIYMDFTVLLSVKVYTTTTKTHNWQIDPNANVFSRGRVFFLVKIQFSSEPDNCVQKQCCYPLHQCASAQI